MGSLSNYRLQTLLEILNQTSNTRNHYVWSYGQSQERHGQLIRWQQRRLWPGRLCRQGSRPSREENWHATKQTGQRENHRPRPRDVRETDRQQGQLQNQQLSRCHGTTLDQLSYLPQPVESR